MKKRYSQITDKQALETALERIEDPNRFMRPLKGKGIRLRWGTKAVPSMHLDGVLKELMGAQYTICAYNAVMKLLDDMTRKLYPSMKQSGWGNPSILNAEVKLSHGSIVKIYKRTIQSLGGDGNPLERRVTKGELNAVRARARRV